MSFNYARAQATALRLLTNFGADATLTKRVQGAYDPSTGTSTVTETPYTVKAVILNYTRLETGKMNDTGTLVEANDRKMFIQSLTVAPQPDDTIAFDGVTYRIVNIKTLDPAGTTVLQECQVRT